MRSLIQRLEITIDIRVDNLLVYSDSQLVVTQVNYNYKAKEPNIVMCLTKVKHMVSLFKKFEIRKVPKV